MKVEFSEEQVQVLHQIVSKSQIPGEAARVVGPILDSIEKALSPKEENKRGAAEPEKSVPAKK